VSMSICEETTTTLTFLDLQLVLHFIDRKLVIQSSSLTVSFFPLLRSYVAMEMRSTNRSIATDVCQISLMWKVPTR
jgi:hypothetical protein